MIFEERVEVYVSKWKIFLNLLMALAFMAMGTWMLTERRTFLLFGIIPVQNIVLGGILISIFGFSSYFLIKKLTRKLPVLVLDKKGIFDCTTYPSGVDIPWEPVYDVVIKKIGRQTFVVLSLYDSDAFIDNLPNNYRKRVAKANNNSMGSPAIINTAALTMKPKELLQLIKDRIEVQNKVR